MEDILAVFGEHGEGLWFLAGAVTAQVISKLLGISHALVLIKEITKQILKLVGSTAEDVAFIKTMKFKSLHEAGMEEEQIERIRKVDEETFKNWKASMIIKLIVHCPREFRHVLGFHDWDGAMKVLDDVYKREAKYEKKR